MVEDNPGDITLAENAFRKSKYSVNLVTVLNGEHALMMLRRQLEADKNKLPHLILLDLNLPVVSGHEVLETIKKDHDLKHIPVVILSSSDAIPDIETATKNKASAYIVKPKSMVELRQLVVEVDNFWDSWQGR